jgi:CDP-glycerol glycerophosphotransferase (TagB/SpsB family)
LVADGTLADLVLASDAVIAQMSSVVGEAIMLDRPTVVVDLLQRGGWAGYAATGACLTALTESELAASVRGALEDDDVRAALAAARSAYASDHFLALDGRAAERVAHVVADVAGRITSRDPALGASR